MVNNVEGLTRDRQRAMEFLVFESSLRPLNASRKGSAWGSVVLLEEWLVREARKELGPEIALVSRFLHAGDIPPIATTTREWIETSAGNDNVFVQGAIGDGTPIANNTWIGFFGARFIMAEDADGVKGSVTPPASSLRFVVGGTRVAEWDLYTIWVGMSSAATVSNDYGASQIFPYGIAESPVLIGRSKQLELQFYEIENTLDWVIHPMGLVVEPAGQGDGIQP